MTTESAGQDPRSISNNSNKDGMLLLEAASLGNILVILRLLNAGVDINFCHPNNKWTALHWATKRNHCQIVELLLGREADPLVKAANGSLASDLCHSDEMCNIYNKYGIQVENTLPAETNASSACYVPNYIKYPLKTRELDEIERQLDGDLPKHPPSQVHNEVAIVNNGTNVNTSQAVERKEFFVYIDKELRDCCGSVLLDPTSISVDEMLNMIYDQLDISAENKRIFKYVTERKLAVPVNKKQLNFTVSDIFSTSDIIIIN